MLQRIATALTHRLYEMPVLVLMPHSRCNCRCVMCDIWKGNQAKHEISVDELARHVARFQHLGVKRVALSGGEALMHPNLWKFCDLLTTVGAKVSLLSTGLTVKTHAAEIVRHCDDLIVSLDGSRDVHNRIRNIPGAFEKLEEGIHTIRQLDPSFRITLRTVLQKLNFRDFPNILATAKKLGVNQISFLPADISSSAFNRALEWPEERKEEVALTETEAAELETILEDSFVTNKREYEDQLIAESPRKMRQVLSQYRAYLGLEAFPKRKCNAPWVSAVIESNGDVMPCFFHKAYGNIHDGDFDQIINSPEAIDFRKHLNIGNNPTCQRCVCSIHINPLQKV